MSAALPSRFNLGHLKNEAKAWLKACRAGDPAAVSRLQKAGLAFAEEVGLRQVQQALAREYGYASWQALARALPAAAAEPTTFDRWLAATLEDDLEKARLMAGPASGSYSSHRCGDGPDFEVRWQYPLSRLEVRSVGSYRVAGEGLASMGPGSRLEIAEKEAGSPLRAVVLQPGGEGAPRTHWSVGGQGRPVDDRARAFIGRLLPVALFEREPRWARRQVAAAARRRLDEGGIVKALLAVERLWTLRGPYLEETARLCADKAAALQNAFACAAQYLPGEEMARFLLSQAQNPAAVGECFVGFVKALERVHTLERRGEIARRALEAGGLGEETARLLGGLLERWEEERAAKESGRDRSEGEAEPTGRSAQDLNRRREAHGRFYLL